MSLKEYALKCVKKVERALERPKGPKRPSQEELERDVC